MQLRFPDGHDADSFLREYWQKRPLLMRDAFDPSEYPMEADELAGLALHSDVEARLITGPPHGQFTVRESPFSEQELTDLPPNDWTLLVQDVDKHWPELGGFCDLFGFIPRWRFDDLMISVAAPGGGVGPHIDQYDVFLCQHTGERRWQLAGPGGYPARDGVPLRQIEGFVPEETITLTPGDVLYLPPGVPHDGLAKSFCGTWSVGFRAPTRGELLAGFAQQAGSDDSGQRYSDPDLEPEEAQDGSLGARALARFSDLLGSWVPEDGDRLAEQLGEFLSTPKAWLMPEVPEPPLCSAEFAGRLEAGENLLVHGMALFIQVISGRKRIIFASGSRFAVPAEAAALANALAARRSLSGHDLNNLTTESLEFLRKLYNAGQLMFEADYHDL